MMVTSIWLWRRIMLARGLWTRLTASPHFAKLGTTCRKCKMPTSGQARDVSMGCGLIHEPSTRTWIPAAASYSPTNELITRELRDQSRGGGMLERRKIFHNRFARVSLVF